MVTVRAYLAFVVGAESLNNSVRETRNGMPSPCRWANCELAAGLPSYAILNTHFSRGLEQSQAGEVTLFSSSTGLSACS